MSLSAGTSDGAAGRGGVESGTTPDMDHERRREQVRTVRRRLSRDGPPWTRREDSDDFDRVTVPERDCDALRDLLVAERAERVVEIGLAYGSSALAIAEALLSVGADDPRHVIVDPFQASGWSNVGWRLLRSAGLESIARLVLEPSSVALAELVAADFVADAAFVDGSHRYHEVFVDLYFLRKVVRPGGVVILDDYGWPSVRTAVAYYETNLGWRRMPDALAGGSVDRDTGHTRAQAFRLPERAFEPAFAEFRQFW
jgi:predicted O-methyltransferase YrrM